MSSISVSIPTFDIDSDEFQNIVRFIYSRRDILKEYGAIKIRTTHDCKMALKKRRNILPPSTSNLFVLELLNEELIYSIKTMDSTELTARSSTPVTGEQSFWWSLSQTKNENRRTNVSVYYDKSFFSQKMARSYFDIHRVPNQSLLKIGGRKVTSQLTSLLTRADEPGAIFPLASARQNLFSLNYHHQGGARHWYIIPHQERASLQMIVEKQKSTPCLDHAKLLIDPSVLDKHYIRYHHIVQYPKEFLVLAAGALSQSFAEDSCWNESIEFALPSWIEEGHATASPVSCPCDSSAEYFSQPIDPDLFRHELVQRFIATQLKGSNDETSPTTTVHNDDGLSKEVQTLSYPTDLAITTPPTCHWSTDDDEKKLCDSNHRMDYEIIESQGHFWTTVECCSHSITPNDSILSEHGIDMEKSTSQTLSSIEYHNELQATTEKKFVSLEELMNLVPQSGSHPTSANYQDDTFESQSSNPTESCFTDSSLSINDRSTYSSKKDSPEQLALHRSKTLFVSGLRTSLSKTDLRLRFPDCIKVTLKQSKMEPYLKYAFILHRTFEAATRNLHRPIDRAVLGNQCFIEYAQKCSDVIRNDQYLHGKKLVVSHIPENVTENDLCELFADGHLLKYCPARSVHQPTMTKTKNNHNNKILWGYAFILFKNQQKAIDVIRRAGQYRIHGHSLVLSFYHSRKHH